MSSRYVPYPVDGTPVDTLRDRRRAERTALLAEAETIPRASADPIPAELS